MWTLKKTYNDTETTVYSKCKIIAHLYAAFIPNNILNNMGFPGGSAGRFLKMLKRYPQFQGYRLLWFLVKFTRSESAGAWRSQLGRRHRGWVGGWVGGSQEMSTGLADTLHKRLSHGCQLQELFLLGPELSFLSIFMDRIMAPLQKFTPPIALWSQRGRCMGTGSPLLSEVTSTWSLPQSKWREHSWIQGRVS